MRKTNHLRGFLQDQLLLALMALLLPCSCLQAQTEHSSATPPEEIIITEKMDFYELKAKTFEAERAVYKIFNALNDDDDYDIICPREKPTGSLLGTLNCRPKYMDKLMLFYHETIMDQYHTTIPDKVMKDHIAKAQELMLNLMATHEELRNAVAVHSKLVDALKQRTAN